MTASPDQAGRSPIDWAVVRQRLAETERLLTQENTLPPEEAERVLRERARALAARRKSGPQRVQDLEVVLFRIAGESLAVESRLVLEVIKSVEVSPLPGAEPPISGLAAWRGELVPVLDLPGLLGLEADASEAPGSYLVLGDNRSAVVVSVEEVSGLREFSSSELLRPDPQSSRAGGLVRGTTADAVVVLTLWDLIRTYS